MRPISISTLVRDVDPEKALARPKGSDLRFVRMGDVATFITALREGVPAGYIAAHRLDHELRTHLIRILTSVPDAYLVVGLEDAQPVNGVPAIVNDRILTVAPLPREITLQWAVSTSRIEARVAEVRRCVDDLGLHRHLRKGLCTIVAERRCSDPHHPKKKVAVVKSIPDLAARCGVDKDTLLRHARKSGVDLKGFIPDWRAMVALWERHLGRENGTASWLVVARRVGYADASGVQKLLKWTLGFDVSVNEVDPMHLDLLLDRLKARLGGEP